MPLIAFNITDPIICYRGHMNKHIYPLIALLAIVITTLACSSSFNVVGTQSPASAPIDVQTESAPTAEPSNLLPSSLYYLGKGGQAFLQVFRMERDSVTTHQVTFEPFNVDSYDVSPVDGSVAYVSNNQLLWVDANGSDRRLLVDGGQVDAINPFVNTLRTPVFSPDGKTIAYGYKGLHFYSLDSGASSIIMEDQTRDFGNGLIIPKELYSPSRYSPDGTKLLVTLGYYEGASSAIYYIANGSLVRLTDDNGALICCGREVWTSDGSAFYSASSTTGMFTSGLWRTDATSGQVTELFSSNFDTNDFNYASDPYLAPDGQLYYFFFASNNEIQMRTPLQLARSAPDGATSRTTLRTDTFEFMNEALWAPDASFVVVLFAPTEDVYYGGQAKIVYLDGRPDVPLISFSQDLKWGP